jgi:tRNA-specific 2-thiouridylase
MPPKEKIAVAMSGGVDSSVAAALLQQQGHEIFGITMHHWDAPEVAQSAAADAASVCASLGIPHFVVDLRKAFSDQIIRYFINEYLAARTPNPCVRCNRLIKWGSLLENAQNFGAEKIATGHYAQVTFDESRQRFVLFRGRDQQKEQSYALWGLSQAQLARTIFPLGQLTKPQVRQTAAALNLKTAQKSESQEICFIPDDNYERFLKNHVPGLAERLLHGEVIHEDGRMLGFHRGYPFYTIGQRKGLRVAAGERIYVNRIDPQTNRVYVGSPEKIKSHGLRATEVNWVALDGHFARLTVTAKIRYKDPGFPADLIPVSADTIELQFHAPQKSVTPGQSAVFYLGDEVVGGGIIEQAR